MILSMIVASYYFKYISLDIHSVFQAQGGEGVGGGRKQREIKQPCSCMSALL